MKVAMEERALSVTSLNTEENILDASLSAELKSELTPPEEVGKAISTVDERLLGSRTVEESVISLNKEDTTLVASSPIDVTSELVSGVREVDNESTSLRMDDGVLVSVASVV